MKTPLIPFCGKLEKTITDLATECVYLAHAH